MLVAEQLQAHRQALPEDLLGFLELTEVLERSRQVVQRGGDGGMGRLVQLPRHVHVLGALPRKQESDRLLLGFLEEGPDPTGIARLESAAGALGVTLHEQATMREGLAAHEGLRRRRQAADRPHPRLARGHLEGRPAPVGVPGDADPRVVDARPAGIARARDLDDGPEVWRLRGRDLPAEFVRDTAPGPQGISVGHYLGEVPVEWPQAIGDEAWYAQAGSLWHADGTGALERITVDGQIRWQTAPRTLGRIGDRTVFAIATQTDGDELHVHVRGESTTSLLVDTNAGSDDSVPFLLGELNKPHQKPGNPNVSRHGGLITWRMTEPKGPA